MPPAPFRTLARVSRQVGFTLVELLVTIAIIAIMLALVAPEFSAYQRNAQLTSTANSFLATLANARAAAMNRGLNAYVVPASNNDWTTGWIAFVDRNFNRTFDATTDIQVGEHGAVASGISVFNDATAAGFDDGGTQYVMFNAAGYPTLAGGGFTGGALEFRNGSTAETLQRRRVVVNVIGRMRVCRPDTEAATCTPDGF